VNFDLAFERLLGHEGAYVNDPRDPGQETNWGISKRSYPHLDIKSLTREQAKAIYREDFWDKVGDSVHPAIKYQLFDFAVNSGISRAIKELQRAVHAVDDGKWGPKSNAAARAMCHHDILMRFLAFRLRFMVRLPNWKHASGGWANRVADNLLFAAEDN
jgi:lysozyme family protein